MVSDYNRTKAIEFSKSINFDTQAGFASNTWYCKVQLDLGGNAYRYLLFVGNSYLSWALVNLETREIFNYCRFSSSNYHETLIGGWNETQNESDITFSNFKADFYLNNFYADIYEISDDGILTLRFLDSDLSYGGSREVKFNLYAF